MIHLLGAMFKNYLNYYFCIYGQLFQKFCCSVSFEKMGYSENQGKQKIISSLILSQNDSQEKGVGANVYYRPWLKCFYYFVKVCWKLYFHNFSNIFFNLLFVSVKFLLCNLMNWWIGFVVWLTDERYLALFPSFIIVNLRHAARSIWTVFTVLWQNELNE